MANSEQTKRTGGPQGQSDDPRQAIESGEPNEAGRSAGRPVDQHGQKAASDRGGKTTGDAQGKSGAVGQDYESGRQEAK